MNNPIYNPFLNKVAQSLKWKLNAFMAAYQKQNKDKKEAKWNNEFTNNAYITFNTYGIGIELYKDSVLSPLIYFQEFENTELNFMTKILHPGDVVLDIGANIGLFSLIAAKCVGDSGKVIAFEPSLKVFNRLKRNIQLNQFTQIEPLQLGLSDKPGELMFYERGKGYDAWSTFAHTESTEGEIAGKIVVPVSTLDHQIELMLQKGKDPKQIKFIKIDVEGWEKFVAQGGSKYFKEYSPTVMVEFTDTNAIQAGYFMGEVYELFITYGYTWHQIGLDGKLEKEPRRVRYPYNNLVAIKL